MPTAAGIYYAESNDKNTLCPPVILIHGAGSSHQCWPALIRRLPGYRVLALDLPGHGRSEGIALQSVTDYAYHLLQFMAATDIYQAVLVGHSLGGAIALETAWRFKEHIAAVGMIASSAFFNIPPDLLDYLTNPLTQPDAVQQIQKHFYSKNTPSATIKQFSSAFPGIRPGVIAGDWMAAGSFDLRLQVPQIDIPTWIAAGADDRLIPPAHAHFLESHLPRARLQIFSDAGHMLMLEKPQAVSEGLSAFLTELTIQREGIRWEIESPASESNDLEQPFGTGLRNRPRDLRRE